MLLVKKRMRANNKYSAISITVKYQKALLFCFGKCYAVAYSADAEQGVSPGCVLLTLVSLFVSNINGLEMCQYVGLFILLFFKAIDCYTDDQTAENDRPTTKLC